MQRLLSLATLAIMGGLGWLFLQGGGLSQMSVPRDGQSSGGSASGGFQTPGSWQAPAGQPTHQSTYSKASTGRQNSSHNSRQNAQAPPPQNVTGGPTIRIASFNIQVFGNTKASKPYVMQELADIINQFDVVAIQEVRSKDEYLIPNFVQLINRSGRRFDHVIGPRVGYTTSKEQYVFLYDTQKIEVDRQSVYTMGDRDGMLHREPLVATFRTRVDPDKAFTFTLVNMHTDPDEAAEEMDALAQVYKVVRRSSDGEDDIIMLGDFNVDDRHLGRLGELPDMVPLIAGVWTNTRQNKQYDNLIIHQRSTTEYVGRSGVFDFMRFKNLSLKQAVQVSDHFPVWAEFSIYERDYAGRVASRRRRRSQR